MDTSEELRKEEASSSSSSSYNIDGDETTESSSSSDEAENAETLRHHNADEQEDDNDDNDDDAAVSGESAGPLDRANSLFADNFGSKRGEIVPIQIDFSNMFYSVRQFRGVVKQTKKKKNPFAKENKYILKDLYASFKPSQLTVIMGPSGAGKTTLLNLLAGRTTGGKIEGKILINGVPRNKISRSKWRKLVAYVMQDDILHGNLTARETFAFSACLRLPGAVIKPSMCKQRVQGVISELGLESCASTRIGTPASRGVSGGQRKRVSIGMELITEPSVLFLDEPTTGLDSSTSYSLTLTLQRMARMGRTIVATIHQPSSDMFDYFDRVIFMARGNIIYNGPAKEMVPYFSRLNYKCPKYTNPSEYVMSIASEDSYISDHDEGVARLKELINGYRAHRQLTEWNHEISDNKNHNILKKEIKEKKKAAKKSGEDGEEENSKSEDNEDIGVELPKTFKPQKSANFIIQFLVLTVRQLLMFLREKMATYVRLIQTLFLSLLVGFLYLQIGDDQSSIQDREGALFFVIMSIGMGPLMLATAIFPSERLVFVREHVTGAYGTWAFFTARTLSEIPFQIVFPALYSVISYWMVGFDGEASKFFIYMACLICVANSMQALGMAVCAGIKKTEIALALTPIIFTPMMLVGGLFLNSGSIPDYVIWVKYLSPIKWGFEILILNEMKGKTFYCTSSQLSTDGKCPITSGNQVIELLSLNEPEVNIWSNFLMLLALYLFFQFIAFVSLALTAGRSKGT